MTSMRRDPKAVQDAAELTHQQDVAALARLRARLKLTPTERWELWDTSMRSLQGWHGIARNAARPASARRSG